VTADEVTTDPIRVLYVDDEDALTVLVAEFLERFDDGLVVDTATLVEEGLRRLLEPTADDDCVVSDFQMPGMNGEEFLHAVRAKRPKVPFVLFTGEGNDALERRVAADASAYLRKGTGTDQYRVLGGQIRRAVGRPGGRDDR
jgi:CheY-like chemotaxis protein